MKAEEAYALISDRIKAELEECKPFPVELQVALEVIEMQIPKKPKIIGSHNLTANGTETNILGCPVCGNYITRYIRQNDFCNKCGHAIDWSEVEE